MAKSEVFFYFLINTIILAHKIFCFNLCSKPINQYSIPAEAYAVPYGHNDLRIRILYDECYLPSNLRAPPSRIFSNICERCLPIIYLRLLGK